MSYVLVVLDGRLVIFLVVLERGFNFCIPADWKLECHFANPTYSKFCNFANGMLTVQFRNKSDIFGHHSLWYVRGNKELACSTAKCTANLL